LAGGLVRERDFGDGRKAYVGGFRDWGGDGEGEEGEESKDGELDHFS
jgi:hypothetical protein